MTAQERPAEGTVPAASAVGLVARREITTRVRSRAFQIGLAVTMVLVVGLLVAGRFVDTTPGTVTIGVVGDLPAGADAALTAVFDLQDRDVDLVALANRAEAEAALDDGDVDVVVVDGARLLVADDAAAETTGLVSFAVGRSQLVQRLEAAGLSPAEADRIVRGASGLPVEVVGNDDRADEGVSFAIVVFMFIAIQLTGTLVLNGVTEEKSSRVVELVLSSIPARHLLAGKIIGIGLLGLGQILVLVVIGLGGALLVLDTGLPDLAAGTVVVGVGWFVIGYLLFAALFAAAGSLVSRSEDAQATMAPLMAVLVGSYVASLWAASTSTGPAVRLLSLVPTIAPFAMPARFAVGSVSVPEHLLAAALTIGAAVGTTWLGGRVYERSVLGGRSSWRVALGGRARMGDRTGGDAP